jgi:hypothetical protein
MHFRRSRRLISASAYYEWQDLAVGKQPWYFTPADGEPITFAGLWDEWKDKATGEILHDDHYGAERFCCRSPRPHARNPWRNSFAKGALQNHICRFESCMPSQPERSLLFGFRRGFAVPVSARHFPISVSAYPRPVRYVTETGLRSRFRACTAAKVERWIDQSAAKRAEGEAGLRSRV